MKRVKFNINDYVLIKLTDKGLQHWKQDFEKFPMQGYTFEEHSSRYTTKDGYARLQCHVLMELFGERMTAGSELFFETTIFFETKED